MAPQPRVAYQASAGSPLDVDRAPYDALAADTGRRELERFQIAPSTGRAWVVRRGQVCRLATPEGPQVGDFNVWSLHDPSERMWAARTRQLQRAHVSTYDRLWSCLPYLRPLLTFVADSVDYGVDEHGARCHDLLGTRCDPYVHRMLTGEDLDVTCHSNLVRAIVPYGLLESDVHDVLNVFQVTGLTCDEDRYFMQPSPARAGDRLEFVAEMDLLCALSACPGGDLSVPMWGPDAGDPREHCRPLEVTVFEPGVDVRERLATDGPGALASGPNGRYAGNHGMR